MGNKLQDIAVIDAHLHLWDRRRMEYVWLDLEPGINQDFLISDYQNQTRAFNIEKMVFVQADCKAEQYLDELDFVAEQVLADQRIKAIVAYAPLEQGRDVQKVLVDFELNPFIKGVRKMYDQSPELCVDAKFLEAVALLPEYNLSMDVSIKPASIKYTLQMMKSCPDTLFILDHLAKPDIRQGALTEFRKHIDAFASLPNVVAKVSGLITEADREGWTEEGIKPYIDHAIKAFGFDRLMYGSDWPVVLLAGSYEQWIQTLFNCVEGYSIEDQKKLFYETANRIYRLQ